jgi:DNA recombination protein RmuC
LPVLICFAAYGRGVLCPSDAVATVHRLMIVVAVIVGFGLGAAAAWLLARSRMQVQVARLETALEHERAVSGDVSTRFKALSAETLERTVELAKGQFEQYRASAAQELQRRHESFEQLVKPIKESLERVDGQVKTLEESRRQDYGALTTQLRTLSETTGSLATALRSPSVRGRWGEMQLRNAVEAAGMQKYCDFEEQASVTMEDGRLRPDLIVRLPGGRRVIVDAKVPLQALLDAEACADAADRECCLSDFVRHVRDHVAKLSQKAYWQQFSPTPDFVILFLPGEGFYRTAIERDPALLELAPRERVHIASPATLITLLRAVAVGWREAEVAENARAIEKLGRELYERLATMTDHFVTLGRRLDGAVQAYNQSVGSLERRVLVSARRFVEHGVGSDKELDAPAPIERSTQPPQTIELPAVRAADAA